MKPPNPIVGQDSRAEDLVRKFIAVWNTHDLDALGPMFDPGLVFYSPPFPDGVKGIEARKKTDENFLKSLPDFQFTILRMASKEGFVASELIGAGTSTGPAELPGRPPIPPTGRRVEFRLAGFFNLNSKGLITDERYIYDRVIIIQGLGLKF